MKIKYTIKTIAITPGTAVQCTTLEEAKKVVAYLRSLAKNQFSEEGVEKSWEEVEHTGGMWVILTKDRRMSWNRLRESFQKDHFDFKCISFKSTGL